MRDLGEFGQGDVAALGQPCLRGLVYMGGQTRHALEQRVKILRIKHQKSRFALRRDRSASIGPVQQRDFAEECAV